MNVGVKAFDVADIYVNVEEIVGRLLRRSAYMVQCMFHTRVAVGHYESSLLHTRSSILRVFLRTRSGICLMHATCTPHGALKRSRCRLLQPVLSQPIMGWPGASCHRVGCKLGGRGRLGSPALHTKYVPPRSLLASIARDPKYTEAVVPRHTTIKAIVNNHYANRKRLYKKY